MGWQAANVTGPGGAPVTGSSRGDGKGKGGGKGKGKDGGKGKFDSGKGGGFGGGGYGGKGTMAEKTTMVVVAALVVVGEYELLVPKDVDVLKRKLGKESPRDAASMASLAS